MKRKRRRIRLPGRCYRVVSQLGLSFYFLKTLCSICSSHSFSPYTRCICPNCCPFWKVNIHTEVAGFVTMCQSSFLDFLKSTVWTMVTNKNTTKCTTFCLTYWLTTSILLMKIDQTSKNQKLSTTVRFNFFLARLYSFISVSISQSQCILVSHAN